MRGRCACGMQRGVHGRQRYTYLLTSVAVPYTVEYFSQRVLDEIQSWPVEVLADYARLIELIAEFGPGLRMPHSRALGSGLFELRPRGSTGTGRALYCFVHGKRVVILHAFLKKTRRIQRKELEIARERMKEVLREAR